MFTPFLSVRLLEKFIFLVVGPNFILFLNVKEYTSHHIGQYSSQSHYHFKTACREII